ncbi:MAG: hypothetical protein JSR44_16045 [Spirochaetes bacterium]|nr:hypothetical protein [Spirochaetota bacterium]
MVHSLGRVFSAIFFACGFALAALEARLTHDTGNSTARQQAASESLSADEFAGAWGYRLLARREGLTDRTLTSAAGLFGPTFALAEHRFFFGLGTHFFQQNLGARVSPAGDALPALAAAWRHSVFHFDAAASQKMTRASLSFLLRIGVPTELNSEFEYLFSQPYRWSANLFAHITRYGGLIAGYEPIAERARAGLWLKPTPDLQLRTLVRFDFSNTIHWELSLSYRFETLASPTHAPATFVAERATQERVDTPPARQVRPQKAPAFATLVKWGLSPVEALKFARDKNICALSAGARTALEKHNWVCRDAA